MVLKCKEITLKRTHFHVCFKVKQNTQNCTLLSELIFIRLLTITDNRALFAKSLKFCTVLGVVLGF